MSLRKIVGSIPNGPEELAAARERRDHLPDVPRYEMRYPISLKGEGPAYGPILHAEGGWITYADHVAALRACEQRVAAETISRLDRWQQHSPVGRKTYQDGVQAAREAVAAIPWFDRFALGRRFQAEALAAIDALKGEQT